MTLPEEHLKPIFQMVEDGLPYHLAVRAFGFTSRAANKWFALGKTFPHGVYGKFRQGVIKAQAKCAHDRIKDVKIAGAVSWQAAAWWLERTFPADFASDRELIQDLKRFLKERRKEKAKVLGARAKRRKPSDE